MAVFTRGELSPGCENIVQLLLYPIRKKPMMLIVHELRRENFRRRSFYGQSQLGPCREGGKETWH